MKRRFGLFAILLVTSSVAMLGFGSARVGAVATYYVSTNGSDAATGTAAAPFRTVAKAVRVAPSGSTVVIGGGTYHESVQVYAKAIRLQAAAGEQVVFDGSSVVTGWTPSGGAWAHPWSLDRPILTAAPVDPANPAAGYPDQVFVDGVQLREVTALDQVTIGTFFHDNASDLLWLGSDPTGHEVEVSDLSWAVYFNDADGSSLSGVTVQKYATAAADMAAVRAYGDGITVDHTTIQQNAYIGLSFMGVNDTASYVTLINNGYLGGHAHKSTNVTFANSTIIGNNKSGFDVLHSAAGVKVTTSTGVAFDHDYVAANDGPGIWTDITSSSITVTNNLLERNTRSGVEIELSGHVVVAGNVALGNGGAGIWVLESNDVQVWNNAAYGNQHEIWVEDGPRTSATATSAAIWDLARVEVRNNVVGQGAVGEQALLTVEDWTQQRSGAAMAVTADANAYWLPGASPTRLIARWAMWPSPPTSAADLAQQRAATGQDGASIQSSAATNPFARNAAGYDYRMPVDAAPAATPPPDVAALLGVPAGAAIPQGPMTVVVPTMSATDAGLLVPARSAHLTKATRVGQAIQASHLNNP